MSKFIPKKFLNKEITQDNCGHQLLSTPGYDDGMYGIRYECLICGKHIHYGIYDKQDIGGKYIFLDYGFLTVNDKNLIKIMLNFIAEINIDKPSLNIATIFNRISPELESISSYLTASLHKQQKALEKRKEKNK